MAACVSGQARTLGLHDSWYARPLAWDDGTLYRGLPCAGGPHRYAGGLCRNRSAKILAFFGSVAQDYAAWKNGIHAAMIPYAVSAAFAVSAAVDIVFTSTSSSKSPSRTSRSGLLRPARSPPRIPAAPACPRPPAPQPRRQRDRGVLSCPEFRQTPRRSLAYGEPLHSRTAGRKGRLHKPGTKPHDK